MDARAYIEAIAAELSRVRGAGLFLSASDAKLALGWHAAAVPLTTVLEAVRDGKRLKARKSARGAGEPAISLSAIAPTIEARSSSKRGKAVRVVTGRDSLRDELLAAAAVSGLRARAAWIALANDAETLLATSADAYWTRTIAALRAALPELSRAERQTLVKALRERMPRRPGSMTHRRFRRAQALHLLKTASSLFSLPPAPFLL